MRLHPLIQFFIDARDNFDREEKYVLRSAEVCMCFEQDIVFIHQLPPTTCRHIKNLLLLIEFFTSLHFTLADKLSDHLNTMVWGKYPKTPCESVKNTTLFVISHISPNKIYFDFLSWFFTAGDPSFEMKTLLFLPLANVRVSVQIFIVELTILVIFGQTLAKFKPSADAQWIKLFLISPFRCTYKAQVTKNASHIKVQEYTPQ